MIFQLKCLFTDKMGGLQMAPDNHMPSRRQKGLSPASTKASAGKALKAQKVICFPEISNFLSSHLRSVGFLSLLTQ